MSDPISYKEWINNQKENFKYYNPAPLSENLTEQFPILATTLTYEDGITNYETIVTSVESMKEAQKAGFNVCLKSSMSWSYLQKCVDNSKATGMPLITRNANYIAEDTEDYKRPDLPPEITGINLYDEPRYDQLVNEVTNIEDYEYLKEAYKKYLSLPDFNRSILINLLGIPIDVPWGDNEKPDDTDGEMNTSEDKDAIERAKYKKYVQAFQDNFKPSLFCFDIYPIAQNANLLFEGFPPVSNNNPGEDNTPPEGEVVPFYIPFYNAMSVMYDISKKHNRPFWAYCQGVSFMYTANKNDRKLRPIALEQYLRFEAFTAIAYGAKGIIYWTYGMRANDKSETYFSAFLDRKNRRTAAWYFVRNINAEIKKYSELFLKSNVEEVKRITPGNSYDFVNQTHNFSISIKEGDRGIIVSKRIWKDDVYLMVVSRDAVNYQTLTLFLGKGTVEELTPLKSTGPDGVFPLSGYSDKTIIPGGYQIYKLWTNYPL